MPSDSEKPASTSQNIGIKNLIPFVPGQSGNPGGRPRTAHISEALRDELEALAPSGKETNAQAIAKRLVTTARDAKRDSQATQAAEMIADRIEGKPMQGLRVERTIDENTLARLNDIAERLFLGIDAASGGYQFPYPTPQRDQRQLPDVASATILDAAAAAVFSEQSTATTTATNQSHPSKD